MVNEQKLKRLDECIYHVTEVTGLPYWVVRIEMADEAGVSSVEMTENEIDKMISLYEEYYPSK